MKEKIQKKNKFHYSARDKRKFPFVYAIIFFPVVQIILFYFYVNFSSLAMTFQDSQGNWSLESIKQVFKVFSSGVDENLMGISLGEMFLKTLIPWIIDNVITFVVIIFTSFVLTKHMIGSKIFRTIFFVPGIVGSVIFAAVMSSMYARGGTFYDIALSLGIDLPEKAMHSGLLADKGTAFTTLMIQRSIFRIAGGDMILASAYMKIPDEIFESAELEGCGFTREIFQIAVPCVWPTITTVFIFSVCTIFTYDYGSYAYAGDNGINTGLISVGYYLYRYQVLIADANGSSGLYSYASAFGWVITLMTVIVVLIVRKIMSKLQEPVSF